MHERHERALILLGACLASKDVRDAVDPQRIADPAVSAAVAEMKAIDAGTLQPVAMQHVYAALEAVGVRRHPGRKLVELVRDAVDADHVAVVRRRVGMALIAPNVFKPSLEDVKRQVADL